MARPPGYHRGVRGHPPAAFIAMQLISQIMALPEKPPLTLALIAIQSLLFYSPRTLNKLLRANGLRSPSWLTNRNGAYLQPTAILRRREWYRVGSAAITHLSDVHLLYNMTSLLMKGQVLEKYLGSAGLGILVVVLGVLAHLLYVAFAWIMMYFAGRDQWMRSSVAGFSGVLFGMKAVLNSKEFESLGYARGTRVFGIPVPKGQAHWAELIIAQMVTPNASFLGHLCGIVAGLLVVKGSQLARLTWHAGGAGWRTLRTRTRSRYTNFGSGTVGTRGGENGHWHND